MTKKIFTLLLAISISLWAIAPSANALTTAELQAQIDTLLATLATLQAQLGTVGGTGTVTGCTITSFSRNLSQGMTGDDVKCLQIVLNSASDTKVADSGVGSSGNETTYFGALTKAAVVKFQNKYAADILASWGLTNGTGYAGSTTRAKLNTLLSGVVTPGTPGTPTEVITGTDFSVALSSDNPIAGTIVADTTTNDGGQALIPALKIKFTNGTGADVKVTSLKFKRTGISSDSDLSQAYLFEGDTKLVEYNSFSSGILTFTNSSGLFTVPKGSSKTITFKFDLTNGTASGKTIKFSVLAVTDVSSDATAVKGVFPLDGNFLTTATAADLGKLTIATTTAAGATVDPSEGLEVYNFTLTDNDQKIQVKRITFTNIGSTDASDLQNWKLYDGGTQLLSTIANMASDKTITFDFGSTPFEINKGVVKQMHLKADIIGGVNRTFQLSIRNQTDIQAYDTEYGIYIKPNASAWVVQSTGLSTINKGQLVLSRRTDSPSGNLAKDATSITLAKYDLKALGEDVKITDMTLGLYGSIGTNGLYNVKIYYDGAQKGTTATAASTSATDANITPVITFGNTFVIKKGETKILEIISDIKSERATSFNGGETLTPKVRAITAEGRSSLQTVSSVSSAANQLTISSGVLTVALNSAIANWSSTIPTGVIGQNGTVVGSFTITAGASEGADVTAIKIVDAGGTFVNLQNLEVYKGLKTTGTQIGTTQSSLTTATTYTFYPSPYISVAASAQEKFYIYADLKTSTTTTNLGNMVVDQVDATGKITSGSVGTAGNVTLQQLFISDAGTLTLAVGDDTPLSANIRGGSGDLVSFTQTKFSAGAAEDIKVTDIIYAVTRGAGGAPTSTVYDISLWDGTTQIGTAQSGLNASTGAAVFKNISWIIPAGQTKSLMLKARVPIVDTVNASSGAPIAFHASSSDYQCAETGICWKGSVSGTVATSSAGYAGNAMYTYKTLVSVVKNVNSPSGKVYDVAEDDLFWFDVTNLGDYTAYFKGVTTTIYWDQGMGHATPSNQRVFTIYDIDNTALGSTTHPSTSAYNAAVLKIELNSEKAIPPKTTKTFKLKGDVRDGAPETSSSTATHVQFYINTGTNFNWDDGLSSSIETSRTFSNMIQGNLLGF